MSIPIDIDHSMVDKGVDAMFGQHPERGGQERRQAVFQVLTAALAEFKVQYGVVQLINGEDPELMPTHTDALAEAQTYIDWIKERDQGIRRQAEKEKCIMDAGYLPQTNHNYMAWFGKRRPLKDATYQVVARYVSNWEKI